MAFVFETFHSTCVCRLEEDLHCTLTHSSIPTDFFSSGPKSLYLLSLLRWTIREISLEADVLRRSWGDLEEGLKRQRRSVIIPNGRLFTTKVSLSVWRIGDYATRRSNLHDKQQTQVGFDWRHTYSMDPISKRSLFYRRRSQSVAPFSPGLSSEQKMKEITGNVNLEEKEHLALWLGFKRRSWCGW